MLHKEGEWKKYYSFICNLINDTISYSVDHSGRTV
jgi:hypothetical protein